MRVFISIYKDFLYLYPKEPRMKFGDEMLATVTATFRDARLVGRNYLLGIWISEIINILPNAIQEHILRGTRMNLQFIGVKRKPGWYFYIAWVVINSLYAPLAGWISNYIYDIANHLFDNQTVINGVYIFIADYTDHYVIYALWGVIMALTQYLLFRPFIQRLGWWIPLTVILWSGTPIFWIATSGLIPISFNGTPVLWRIFFIMPGLILSIFQWLILRKRVYAAHFWLIGSFIGWVFTSISYLIPLSGITPNLEFSILAIATTFVLWIIFRRNPELVEMKVTSPS